MSYTTVLVRHPEFSGLLGGAGSKAERMEIVEMARLHATMILGEAMRRIPVEKPSVIAAYKAKGLDPVWMLNDNDDAVRFWLTLSSHDHTPAEKAAADLLRSCVAADEFGDVPEFNLIKMGENASATQANRRIGKTKLDNRQKLAIVREYKAAFTTYGMTQTLADKYGVSEDTIRRTVKKPKQD